VASPVARPMMLMAEKPLFFQRFLVAILKKFLSMLQFDIMFWTQ
jgi:hypothetical protein